VRDAAQCALRGGMHPNDISVRALGDLYDRINDDNH
jgi:hypothetical protein